MLHHREIVEERAKKKGKNDNLFLHSIFPSRINMPVTSLQPRFVAKLMQIARLSEK